MSQNKENSGLATAGMVLGIIAIVGSWIPFLNIVSIILAVLAIIFGLIPLFQKRSIGKAVTGVVLGVITIIIAVTLLNSATDAIDKALNADSSSTATSEPEGAPEKTEYSVGETISFDGKEVTVSQPERNWNSGNEYVTPDTGNEFVKVQVSIKNNSSSNVSYNTFDWKIRNSAGVIKDVDSTAFMVDGGLDSGELAANGQVAGFLVFQVPANDEGLVLQYSPSFWNDKTLEIKL